MKTTHPSGKPFDLEDLLNTFAQRVETLSHFAGIIEIKKGISHEARILTVAISALRDDWSCFEDAVREWDERENGTEYLHTNIKGGKS